MNITPKLIMEIAEKVGVAADMGGGLDKWEVVDIILDKVDARDKRKKLSLEVIEFYNEAIAQIPIYKNHPDYPR